MIYLLHRPWIYRKSLNIMKFEKLNNFARWSAIYELYVNVMVSLALGIYTCAGATLGRGTLFCCMLPSQVKFVRL